MTVLNESGVAVRHRGPRAPERSPAHRAAPPPRLRARHHAGRRRADDHAARGLDAGAGTDRRAVLPHRRGAQRGRGAGAGAGRPRRHRPVPGLRRGAGAGCRSFPGRGAPVPRHPRHTAPDRLRPRHPGGVRRHVRPAGSTCSRAGGARDRGRLAGRRLGRARGARRAADDGRDRDQPGQPLAGGRRPQGGRQPRRSTARACSRDRPRHVNVLLFLSTVSTVTATVLVGYVSIEVLAVVGRLVAGRRPAHRRRGHGHRRLRRGRCRRAHAGPPARRAHRDGVGRPGSRSWRRCSARSRRC